MAPAVKMWRKRFLIPLWLVQLIVLGIYFVLSCVGLSLADNYNDRINEVLDNSNNSDYNYGPYVDDAVTIYRAVLGVIVGFSVFCLLLVFIEIGLAASHKLKPALHLSSACIKALISIIWLVIVIIGSASVGRGYAVDIILSIAITLSTVLQVVYGAIVVHRVRKGYYNNLNVGSSGNYAPVAYKGQGQGDVEIMAQGATYR